MRSWQDEAAVAPALLRLGLMRDDVIEETLRSPAQVEKRAKARGVKVPKELISSKPSGVSLVKAENARSLVLGRGEIVRSFAEALAAFQKGSDHMTKQNDPNLDLTSILTSTPPTITAEQSPPPPKGACSLPLR